MEWRSDYATGSQPIDDQHRELFRREQGLLEAARVGAGGHALTALQSLREHLRRHFAAEQAAMLAAGYPFGDAHAQEHARFLLEILRLEHEGTARPASAWLSTKIALALSSWLREHMLGVDRDLCAFLRARREQGPETGRAQRWWSAPL